MIDVPGSESLQSAEWSVGRERRNFKAFRQFASCVGYGDKNMKTRTVLLAAVSIAGFAGAAESQVIRPLDQANRISVVLVDKPFVALVPSPPIERAAVQPVSPELSSTIPAARKVRVVLASPFAP